VNLSERLEAARREREGLIDLTAARPYATRNEADAASHSGLDDDGLQLWGQPGPCPRCGTKGEVDYVDLVRATMSQHCPSCSFEWTLTRADLDALHG